MDKGLVTPLPLTIEAEEQAPKEEEETEQMPANEVSEEGQILEEP